MGKCLVTRLQGVVSDTTLKKLGEIDFYVTLTAASNRLYAFLDGNQSVDMKITSTDGLHFIDSEGVSLGTELTTNGPEVRLSAGSGTINIVGKYNIKSLAFADWDASRGIGPIDMADLKYCVALENFNTGANNMFLKGEIPDLSDDGMYPNLRNIVFSRVSGVTNNNVTGDIKNFANPNLTELSIPLISVTGNVSLLGRCVNLTSFRSQGTHIEGTSENLAVAMVNAGRTSGTLDAIVNIENVRKRIEFSSSFPNGYQISDWT